MPTNYFANSSANAFQEENQHHHIITLVDPLSKFISSNENDTLSIKEMVNDMIKTFTLGDDVSDIIQETEEKQLVLLSDTVEYILTDIYGLTSELIHAPIQKSLIRTFSTSFKNIIDYFTNILDKDLLEHIEKDFGDSVVTVERVFKYFKDIEDNRSDENFIVKQLIALMNTTTKYDDYKMVFEGNAYTVKDLKQLLASMAPSLFPRKPYGSYFKLSSIMLNGILQIEDVTIDPNRLDQTVSDMKINDFEKVFAEGYVLYFAKVIASIMNAYDIAVQKEDNDTVSKLKTILKDNLTISLKYRDSVSLVYGNEDYNIKMKMKDFLESIYFIPVTSPSFLNDDELYTYNEVFNNVEVIEKERNNSIDNITMEDLLSSQSRQSINDIIRLNNNIKTQLSNAIAKYPDVVSTLIDELNVSIASTSLTQLFNFHESLGSFMMESGKKIASNVVDDSIEQSKNGALGDANNDGNFNAADVVFTASYLAKLEPFVTNVKNDKSFTQRVDVTGDGEISAADVVYMASNLAKLDGFDMVDIEPGSD